MRFLTRTNPQSLILTVGVSLLGALLSTTQGATWLHEYPPLTGDALAWATHGPDGFLVAGAHGGGIVSSNGVDWMEESGSMIGPVIYNGGRYLWAGAGFVHVSTQGYQGFTSSKPLPFGIRGPARSRGIACVSNTCVIVGERGAVYLSNNNGDSWNLEFFNSPDVTWIDVAHGAGAFVAISSGNTIIRSTDGSQWSIQTNLSMNGYIPQLNAVAFGGGRFVAGMDDSMIAVSTNGVKWVITNVPGFFPPVVPDIMTVAWLGSNFLAAASDGTLYSSIDGFDWLELSDRVPASPFAITASSDQIVIVGSAGTISVSSNGLPFTVVNGPHPSTIESMTYAQGQWIGVGEKTALRSINGFDWQPIPGLTNVGPLQGVFFAYNRWFILGSIGTNFVSENGVDWELQAGEGRLLGNPAIGNGVVVSGKQAITYSTNGLDWHHASLQQFTQTGVAYFNGRFVAIGSDVLLSTNGMDWTPQHFITNGYLSAITTTPEGFFLAGSSYAPPFNGLFFARSADGVQWSIETATGSLLSPNNIVTHLAWGRGIYAARIGIGRRPMTSLDGRHWEFHYFQGGMGIHTLSFGGGAFVAAGEGETIYNSDHVPPALGSARMENGMLSLTLYTEPGVTNHLETSVDLTTWNPLPPLVATNAVQRVLRPATATREFLRVR